MGGLLRRPEREATIETALGRLPSVEQVRASSLTGNVLVVFDPAAWTTDELVAAAAGELGYAVQTPEEPQAEILTPSEPHEPRRRLVRAVWAKVPGRARLAVAGLRGRPDVEASVARVIGALDGVTEASANAVTGNVLVHFDPARWTTDRLAAACGEALVDLDRLAREVRERVNGTAAAAPAARRPAASQDWHHQPAETVIEQLDVDPDAGLDLPAVASRRATYGLNRMPEPAEPSLLKTVMDQVVNAPTALLVAGAAVSVATGGIFDAVLIVGVIVVNAGVGAATERSGQRAIATLRRTTAIRARVRRDGAEDTVDAEELVPGDVIQLLPGDPVPADARIISAHRLQVEESALTGESRPVEKWEQIVSADAPLGDRRSMVFRGTTVVGGRASAVVVETGATTADRRAPPPGRRGRGAADADGARPRHDRARAWRSARRPSAARSSGSACCGASRCSTAWRSPSRSASPPSRKACRPSPPACWRSPPDGCAARAP